MNLYCSSGLEATFSCTGLSFVAGDLSPLSWLRQNLNIISALVAKQSNTGKDEGVAPLEDQIMLLSSAVTGNKPKVLMFDDINRAYMHAGTTELEDEYRCGKFTWSMYGTWGVTRD